MSRDERATRSFPAPTSCAEFARRRGGCLAERMARTLRRERFGVTVQLVARIIARSITLRSSRTFPARGIAADRSDCCSAIAAIRLPNTRDDSSTNAQARAGMSSTRSDGLDGGVSPIGPRPRGLTTARLIEANRCPGRFRSSLEHFKSAGLTRVGHVDRGVRLLCNSSFLPLPRAPRATRAIPRPGVGPLVFQRNAEGESVASDRPGLSLCRRCSEISGSTRDGMRAALDSGAVSGPILSNYQRFSGSRALWHPVC